MKKKDFETLKKSMIDELSSPCDMCGKLRGYRTASTHSSYKGHDGKVIWANTSYSVHHMTLGLYDKKREIAGICNKCQKKIYLYSYFHDIVAKVTWYLWRMYGKW